MDLIGFAERPNRFCRYMHVIGVPRDEGNAFFPPDHKLVVSVSVELTDPVWTRVADFGLPCFQDLRAASDRSWWSKRPHLPLGGRLCGSVGGREKRKVRHACRGTALVEFV